MLYVNTATGDVYSLPTGLTGTVLTINGSGVPTWVTPTSGTVTSVGANLPLSVTNPTSTPVISLIGATGTVLYGTGTASAFNTAGATGDILELSALGVPTWVTPASATSTTAWQLTGNAGTTPGVLLGQNFIGTTDNEALVFGTHNIIAGVLDPVNQDVFFGTSSGNWSAFAGQDAVIIGYQAGFNNEGNWNTFIGYEAGFTNTTGTENTYSGYEAGGSNSTTDYNSAYGYQSLFHNTVGWQYSRGLLLFKN